MPIGLSLNFATTFHGSTERDVIGVFEIGACRQTEGYSADRSTQRFDQGVDIEAGGVAFYCRVDGQNNFCDLLVVDAVDQFSYAQLIRTTTLERRYEPGEHMVASFEFAGSLQGHYISGVGYDTECLIVSIVTAANFAWISSREMEAPAAVAHLLFGVDQ